ncbi:MAG: hypothetical protein ABI700_17655 [Chloroflexota bacterium]
MKSRFALVLPLFILSLLLISPVLAQDAPLTGGASTISYHDISLTYDSSLLGAIYPHDEAAFPPDPNNPMPPGSVTPAYTAFSFFIPGSQQSVDLLSAPALVVYTTADIDALGDQNFSDALTALKGLNLKGDPKQLAGVNTTGTSSLPYLPPQDATQVMRFLPKLIKDDTLSGVRYFAYYSQSINLIMEGQIWYTFQGLSADGTRYIAFSYPVTTGQLPVGIPSDFDYSAFSAGYNDYLSATFRSLNGANADNFAPSASALDALVSSVVIATAK